MKFKLKEEREGLDYNTFPIAIFEKRDHNEYSPLLKRLTMGEIALSYPNCYDAAGKLVTVFYSHNYRVPLPKMP